MNILESPPQRQAGLKLEPHGREARLLWHLSFILNGCPWVYCRVFLEAPPPRAPARLATIFPPDLVWTATNPKSELERLDDALSSSPKHAMVCLHHHPVHMGSRWLDGVGLSEAHEFWSVIDAHANVRAVVWGHVHQAWDGKRGGVRLFATPSTGAQFLPHSDRYAVDSMPPAYRSFELHSDGSIDSAVHWVHPAQLQRAAGVLTPDSTLIIGAGKP